MAANKQRGLLVARRIGRLHTPKEKERLKKDKNTSSSIHLEIEYPWILLKTEGYRNRFMSCITLSLYKEARLKMLPDNFRIEEVYNCCYGWLILLLYSLEEFLLWNPVLSKSIKLPLLRQRGYIDGAVLSSPGNGKTTDDLDPNCMILVFHSNRKRGTSNYITYCTIGEKRWRTVVYRKRMSFCNPIILNDFVYVKDWCWLFRINNVNPNGVDETEYCRLPPVKPFWRSVFRGHLVESCGELFYIAIDLEAQEISNIDVFKLDQTRMRWNKVRDVGDRVFLLSGTYSISSWDAANRGGFVYYFSHGCLHSYSFANDSVSTYLLPSFWNTILASTDFFQHLHYLPDQRLIGVPVAEQKMVETKQYEVDGWKTREETDDDSKIYRKEQSLLLCYPDDVIKSVTRFLNPVDYLNFRSLSKTCRRLAPQSELRDAPIHLTYVASPLSPWFISSDNQSGVFKFVDSRLGGEYLVKIPESLMDAKIHHSNYGWWLMSNSKKIFFFYNPFTTEIINLPELSIYDYSSGCWSIGFSSSPTSPRCIVAGIDSYIYWGGGTAVYILEVGKKRWDRFMFQDLKLLSNCCPVFYDDETCYFLGYKGDLGVLNLQDKELKVLEIIGKTDHSKYKEFLLEFNRKLLKIVINKEGTSVEAFALNKTTMCWEKVDNLENRTLYISKFSSFSTPARADWMKNIIFLPRTVEFSNSRELLIGGWIEPSWS